MGELPSVVMCGYINSAALLPDTQLVGMFRIAMAPPGGDTLSVTSWTYHIIRHERDGCLGPGPSGVYPPGGNEPRSPLRHPQGILELLRESDPAVCP